MKTLVLMLRGLLLLTACFVLTGCPAQWKFVFLNVTSEPLQVQYSGYKSLLIPPGESRKQPKFLYNAPKFIFSKQPPPPDSTPIITVLDANGARLYTANGDELFNSVRGVAVYPYVYLRFTRTEVEAFSTLEAAHR